MSAGSLYENVARTNEFIPGDFGGGSPISKCYLMAYLVRHFSFKKYVEIGVYRGKSLFSVAVAIKENGGMAYGIDPFTVNEAIEYDLDETKKKMVNSFLDTLDFEQIYKDVLLARRKLKLSKYTEIIRETSDQAYNYFKEKGPIDMLHIDGNHDTHNVELNVKNYLPLVRDGGIIVFNDINWESVRSVYERIKEDYIILFEVDTFGILIKQEKHLRHLDKAQILSRKLKFLYDKLLSVHSKVLENGLPTVTVGVITYNHERYIKQCLNSIVKQLGEFRLNIIICDDNSSDNTVGIIEQFTSKLSASNRISIDVLRSTENLGMVKNLKRLIRKAQDQGDDYVSIIDGDDYWNDLCRIDKHIKFMKRNPECSISFNAIQLYWQNKNKYQNFKFENVIKGLYDTSDLIRENIIGNISASFICGTLLKEIPDSLFEMFVGDWKLHIFLSQFGDIGFLTERMTVYRKHDGGIWTGGNAVNNNKTLIKSIDDFNRFLNFTYDSDFTNFRNKLVDNCGESHDLAVIDDIFPHPVSGFRYQEFTSCLEHIESAKVFITGDCIHVAGNDTLEELIISYKRKYPKTSGKVQKVTSYEDIQAKLFYFNFLNLAYWYLTIAEQQRKPFIFTLYPGGGFALNNPDSDKKLKRILSSPSFRKVIVTQRITYEYLIKNELCTPEQIVYIFGVVTPLDKLEAEYHGKKHFGIDKDRLDVCFVALKYTEFGQDKGYDIFVEVAKTLGKKYDNIYFHVVGSFDENVLDVSSIKHKITFYGVQRSEWFDEFYKDKDIILSPNLPGMLFQGAFDGFPTASCTEAGIRETAIFCTDELELNSGHFQDGKEIVIVKHDTADIIENIEFYLKHPDELSSIGKSGRDKIKQLYGYDSQILPRINILKNEISTPFIFNEQDYVHLKYTQPTKLIRRIKKFAPRWSKDIYHKIRVRIM